MRHHKLHIAIKMLTQLKGRSHGTGTPRRSILLSHIQVKNRNKNISCQLQCKSQTTDCCVMCNNDTCPVQYLSLNEITSELPRCDKETYDLLEINTITIVNKIKLLQWTSGN